MSVALETMTEPADVTERPFTPSPDGPLEFDARTFLRGKVSAARGEDVVVHVASAVPGPDDTLVVSCMADRNAFDALTRAGVNVTGYRYQRPFERFTANLSVSEISAVTAARSLAAVGDTTGENIEETLPEVDR